MKTFELLIVPTLSRSPRSPQAMANAGIKVATPQMLRNLRGLRFDRVTVAYGTVRNMTADQRNEFALIVEYRTTPEFLLIEL